MEPIWIYLGELRKGRGVSQLATAEAVGLSRQGWRDIETGVTKDPSTGVFIKAMRFLGGSFRDVQDLVAPNATKQDALRLAQERAEYIAAHGIAAWRETASDLEIQTHLRAIENEVTRSAIHIPNLLDLLRRSKRDKKDP